MRRLLVLLLFTALAVGGLLPAGAQNQSDIDDIQRQIDDIERLIDVEQGNRTAAATELAEAQARLQVLLDELAALQAKVDAVEADIADNELALEENEAVLDRLSRELAETRLEIRESRQLVRDRAVEMYMERSLNFGDVIVNVDDVAQVSVGLEYAGHVVESSESLLNALEVLENTEELQQAEVERRRQEIQNLIQALETQRTLLAVEQAALDEKATEVQGEVDKAAALLADINAKIAAFESETAELEREQERIRAEIQRLSTGGGTNPGVLSWPVGGPVTSGFGYRIHPITGSSRFHAGIDISAGQGTPIRAAGSGTVILASWYGGYGNAVVIDHGGGLTTLYAHQSSIAVGVGQSVSTGSTVGYVGSTGFSTGPHLHFETREGGSPVNPMNYLGG